MRIRTFVIAAILAPSAVFISGCTKEDEGEVIIPKVAFEGKPDARLAGKWKQSDADALYTYRPDGTYDYKGRVATPGGMVDNKFTATWGVNGENIFFRDQAGNVSKYKFAIDGKKLTLSRTGSIKSDTVYNRQ